MDTIVITQKLESLRHCIDRISTKCPSDVQPLQTDPDLQDIIVLNLTRSIQLCVDIASHIIAETSEAAPTSMGEAFTPPFSLIVNVTEFFQWLFDTN